MNGSYNLIGRYVRVSDDSGIVNLRGKIGYVKSESDKPYLVGFCLVKFTFDVGSYTVGQEPTYEMYIPKKFLHLVEDDDETILLDEDIETLLDIALDTKDKAWFDQLIVHKAKRQVHI